MHSCPSSRGFREAPVAARMPVRIKGKPHVDSTLKDTDVLRRYLDTAKFVDLLHSQTLFFSRGDQFEDKFEGAFTKSIKHAIEQSYKINKIDSSYDEFKKKLRERVFLNCWHTSVDDSMAMWSTYGRSATAVAITTTVAQLRAVIQESNLPYFVSIARVRYVKHWRDPKLRISPYSNVFAYKVKAYEYEKEARVIIDRLHDEFDATVSETGMRIKVSLNKLLGSIIVAPEAPTWFHDLVIGVADKYGIKTPIRRSKLAMVPI
jgi:hypothetical protein